MTGVKFTFASSGLDETRSRANFKYIIETDEKTFELEETLELPVELPKSSAIEGLLKALHLALGVSYYKAFLPPLIEHPYAMSNNEAIFWNTVYLNGLSEFLFKNNLMPAVIAQFSAQAGSEPVKQTNTLWENEALLGIGGGKDSIVAGELLKEVGVSLEGFVLATGEVLGQSSDIAKVMDVSLLAVNRNIDKQILEINKMPGALNGHIPISLIFALVGALLASARGKKYVVVANEASASIPQTTHNGLSVNHQWSKSLEFELLFQNYLQQHISPELVYFSAVRPLSSLVIAQIFAKFPQYFEIFTSDNSLFKIAPTERAHPRWSLESPKTLSSFILLAPWLSDEDLMRTFGRNLLDQPKLEHLFLSLLGSTHETILDCVGTPQELLISISILHRANRFSDTHLMQIATDKNLYLSEDKVPELTLSLQNHSIPEELKDKLLTAMKAKIS